MVSVNLDAHKVVTNIEDKGLYDGVQQALLVVTSNRNVSVCLEAIIFEDDVEAVEGSQILRVHQHTVEDFFIRQLRIDRQTLERI